MLINAAVVEPSCCCYCCRCGSVMKGASGSKPGVTMHLSFHVPSPCCMRLGTCSHSTSMEDTHSPTRSVMLFAIFGAIVDAAGQKDLRDRQVDEDGTGSACCRHMLKRRACMRRGLF